MEKIKQYYRICGIVPEENAPQPIYNQIKDKVVYTLVSQKHVILFLTPDKRGYKLKETIIGGFHKKNKNHNTSPILIF